MYAIRIKCSWYSGRTENRISCVLHVSRSAYIVIVVLCFECVVVFVCVWVKPDNERSKLLAQGEERTR